MGALGDGRDAGRHPAGEGHLPRPSSSNPDSLSESGGLLYFVANDGTHGIRQWKSDGTEAGTVMVDGPAPAPTGVQTAALPTPREGETTINGLTYFNVRSPEIGNNPYVSDGTEQGTVMLIDPTPNPPDPYEYFVGLEARFLPVAGGKVVFPATTMVSTIVFNPNRPDGALRGSCRTCS